MMLSTIKYSDLLFELKEAYTWLSEKAQINPSDTRLETIYFNLEKIVEKFNSSELEELIEEKGNEELWLSLTESDAFIRTHKALKNIESAKLPRKALKDMIRGPLLPREETPNSAHSRNISFELELAARFQEVGIKLTGFDDIQLDLDGIHIGIQCKRPFSAKGIKNNLRSAKDQIRKKYSSTQQAMIAFSIDKIYETDSKILVVDHESEIKNTIYRQANHFIQENKNDWYHLLNTKIIGILVCHKYICHIKSRNLLTTGFQLDIYDRSISKLDQKFLKSIQERFATKYSSETKSS